MRSPLLFLLLLAFSSAHAILLPARTRLGELDVRDGVPTLNGKPVPAPKLESGATTTSSIEDLRQGSQIGRQKMAYYLFKWEANDAATRRFGYYIVDLSGENPVVSNLIETDADYEWGDNHYAKIESGVLYFGLYQVNPFFPSMNRGPSDRIQFRYRDGKLERNIGTWAGPAKPDRYIEPDESERGPCFNVANVPDCLAEVERTEAEERAKRRAAANKRAKAASAAAAASR